MGQLIGSEAKATPAAGKALHCVIGSGPAGVACAQALLARGARVRLLDAGLDLEPERAEVVARLRQTAPSAWKPELVARLKEGTSASAKGIPLKLIYGSDYPYRECERHVPADYSAVGLRPSLAQGGLSTVWGAAMMPYLQRDLQGWPVGVADLAQHYAAVAQMTGLSARQDDLAATFDLYHEQPRPLELSRQAQGLLQRLERHRASLAGAGISFGQARLAVAAPAAGTHGCAYCGLCMYGCPYGYIYRACCPNHIFLNFL